MGFEFDVVELDLPLVVVPQDGAMIDQEFGGDQDAIQIQGVAFGDAQIVVRHVGCQRAFTDDNGCCVAAFARGDQDFASTDPGNRAQGAGQGVDQVADGQILHARFPTRGTNPGVA